MKFSHLGVAVADIHQAVSVYENVFGYRLLSGPFHDPVQRATICLVGTGTLGDVVLEIVAPLDDESPVNKMLARGLGAYHVCYEVDDLLKTLEAVRAGGCVIVSRPVPAVAFGGRRIAWFYTPSRQLVEILEK
jgi:methylmalonyl-CoA/ethylmalonyl-CoA epimerase